ncbi:MAG: two-component hybrid sensor and regulator [Cyanobacteria bacterium RYN_339]|nr:two-component hybrid sensor and regulator [Cyanobacteria bacterium RYN_339]
MGNEHLFRAIVDHTTDTITIKDLAGRFVYANPGALALVGAERVEAIVGKTDVDFFPPEAIALIARTDAEVVASGVPQSYEISFNSAFWGEKTHLTSKFPYYDETGEIQGVVAVVRDITELKRTELALRDSEERFRKLVEATFDGVAIHDAGVIIEANQALADMFGYPLDELVGLDGPSTAAPEYHAFIQERISTNDTRPYEVEALRKDGTRFAVEIVSRPAHYHGRRVRVSAFRDITERKALEKGLVLQNERLRELDLMKNNFVGTVSHELRTPLTTIRGYAELLEDGVGGELSDTQHGYVQQIVEGAGRLERLVDDLLDYARMEAGAFRLEPREVDLARMVADVGLAFEPQAREGLVVLELAVPALAPLEADPGRVEQVLGNLIGNALKFTSPGGRVAIAVQDGEAAVRIMVTDNGEGIEAHHLPLLFDRFYQVDAGTTRRVGGTGLGLAISRALVEAHGGEIGVESTPGAGSSFWFTLPRGA